MPAQEEPIEPEVYDLKNWPAFYRSVLRYHNATQPDDNTVNGRIETFRKYMSLKVVELLGPYMRPHERYDTSEGWEDWTRSVGVVLRIRDSSAKQPVTVAGHISKFQQGETDECTLWSQLDICASEGEITETQQREMFWAAVSAEIRNRLTAQSPYFDPEHDVWLEKESPKARRAQQALPRKIAVLSLDKQISARRKWIVLSSWVLLIPVPLLALFLTLFIRGNEEAIVGVISTPIFFGGLHLTAIGVIYLEIRELRRSQKDYQALDSEVELDRQAAPAASDPDRVLLA